MLERVLVFETGHRADVARALRAERTNAAGFRVAVIDFLKISNRDADSRRPLPLVHWALHRPQSRRRMSAFGRLRNPDQLRRGERYRPRPSQGGSILDADRGSLFDAD